VAVVLGPLLKVREQIEDAATVAGLPKSVNR
jgi:hypothetical protein